MTDLLLGMTNLFSLFAAVDPNAAGAIADTTKGLAPDISPTTIDNFIHTLGYMPPWVVAGVTVFAGIVAANRFVLPLLPATGPAAPWIFAGMVTCAITAGVVVAIGEYRNPGSIVPIVDRGGDPPPPPPPQITLVDIRVSYIKTDNTWKCQADFTAKDGSDKKTFATDIQREKIDEFGKALTDKSVEWFGNYKDKNPEFNVLLLKEPFPGEQILERTEKAFNTAAKDILPAGRLRTMRVDDKSPEWQMSP
jgi:hypothetical protein